MLLLTLPWFLATTWIVDANNGPGTNFTDLPAAVAAAQTGDTLIVLPGTYSPFQVTGKALTIRGAGASVTIVDLPAAGAPLATTTIQATPAGETFFVSGLGFRANFAGQDPGTLNVLAAARVALANCTFNGDFSNTGRSGVFAQASEVYASRCSFRGGFITFGQGQAGAHVENGAVLSADGCSFFGAFIWAAFAGMGGDGVFVSNSVATLTRSSALGGNAVHGGVSGGDGLEASGTSAVRIVGTASNAFGSGYGGSNPGSALRASTASSIVVHGPVTLNALPNIVVVGPVDLNGPLLPLLNLAGTLHPSGETNASFPTNVALSGGQPGNAYLLVLSTEPAFLPGAAPFLLGDVQVSLGDGTLMSGVVNGAGGLTFDVVFAAFPALLGMPLHTQAAIVDLAVPEIRLTNRDTRVYSL